MSRAERRAQERTRSRLRVGENGPLREVPSAEWPEATRPLGLHRLLMNDRFVVMQCGYPHGIELLMVQRRDGRDGITWDELWELKRLAGFGDHEAVELYPAATDLINVANMRHIWVLPDAVRMPFGLDAGRRLAEGRRP